MRVYVTSIGEKTTAICCEQLVKYGFEVILLDGIEPWFDKYKKFIKFAGEREEICVHVDADVIVNDGFTPGFIESDIDLSLMIQYKLYDLYRNGIFIGQPVVYTPEVIKIIQDNLSLLDEHRPEASAWRLLKVNQWTKTIDRVVGMHGFFQDKETVDRAESNKILRKQIDQFDFDLARRLMKL